MPKGNSSQYMLIKIQPDATPCRYSFTAESLYMFRVSQHPSSGVLKTVTATSGTGHNTGTATSLQRGFSLQYGEIKNLKCVKQNLENVNSLLRLYQVPFLPIRRRR